MKQRLTNGAAAQFETTHRSLKRGEIWKPTRHQTCWEVRILSGVVWMTSEGKTEDVVLTAGDYFLLKGLSNVILEGLTESEVEIALTRGADGERPLAPYRLHPTRKSPAGSKKTSSAV